MASTVWRGFITFGLISIPVRLFRAARAERVSLRRLYRPAPKIRETDNDTTSDYSAEGSESVEPAPELRPVRQASIAASAAAGSEKVVAATSIVKGFEYEKGQYVALEPEELKGLEPKTATEMAIAEFVNLAEIDPVFFETSYYVVPEEAGEKAYSLLYRALQKAGLVAIAQFAMHSREHVVIVRAGTKGLIAHTMFFSSEVRADDEYAADESAVTQKELDLAEMLVHGLAAPFEPAKYHDSYREKLEALIAQRVAGQPVQIAERPRKSAAVVDIAEALQKSLAALKKPAASAAQATSDSKSTAPAKNSGPRKKRAG
jgi:DNA end-binding protein Ku